MNSNFINNELNWFSQIAVARIEMYHGMREEPLDLFAELPAPKIESVTGTYERFVSGNKLTTEERLALILALVPTLKPQLMDCFGAINKLTGIRFMEYGCIEEGGILRPTLETLLFLISGIDIERRINYAKLLTQHPFLSKHCFDLSNAKKNDFSSIRIVPSAELIDLLIFERPYEPRFSSSFPATRLTTERKWEDLILDQNTMDQIQDIILWVKFNDRIRREWNMSTKLAPGYRAMFYGPSGSGKTFTATLLGQITQREVYRIDLSNIVSKYIGETEKNLEEIFKRAEGRNWILFFDEAESLFGKRTGVRDAHDRYANQEVSFLLQKIEEYNGLIVISTNIKTNIDDAFTRRFQSIIRFQIPSPQQRKQIWLNAFSEKVVFENDIDWENISKEYEISGGGIMNVVQYASIRAMSRNEVKITLTDIIDGIKREYAKDGRLS